MLLGRELQIDAKYSNFEFCERAFFMKSCEYAFKAGVISVSKCLQFGKPVEVLRSIIIIPIKYS